MSFQPGTIVKARGREWVVLPSDGNDDAVLLLKPLGGNEWETTGILPQLEPVEPASFSLPNPEEAGDWISGRLLFEAAKLSTRNAAGAIRCWSKIDVEPRPYQLVPLLMALKLDPVRILIADDVGIGKTIEALLIARELWDQGQISRITVLAPPSLVDQWIQEMSQKFRLEDPIPVLSGTASRLERNLPVGKSIFDLHPITVVSLDFIKAEYRRQEFVRTCPEFVIVDEAHSCTAGPGIRHLRFALIEKLAEDPERHMVFVTATPHTGREETFHALLGLLNPNIKRAIEEEKDIKDLLVKHFIQRRRADIKQYLKVETAFPKREEKEVSYSFSSKYRELFDKILQYIDQSMSEVHQDSREHRIRWWSALALFRAFSSSPKAAAATLRTRAFALDSLNQDDADEIGKRFVLDVDTTETTDAGDTVPGSDIYPEEKDPRRKKLWELATLADSIKPDEDYKLACLLTEVEELLKQNFSPIVFCRFIETAKYVAEQISLKLQQSRWGKKVQVLCVDGTLDPEDRRSRIDELAKAAIEGKVPLLVATDCLSEGINLQNLFNAVVHYDLSWNPTRHEQREGRVDRFGQPHPLVKTLTIYGSDNPIDGIVLDVLIQKHKRIRTDTGVVIPVPMDSSDVLSALLEALNFKEMVSSKKAAKKKEGPVQYLLDYGPEIQLRIKTFHADWQRAAEREKEIRTRFAQKTLNPDEVYREWKELLQRTGTKEDLDWFLKHASLRLQGDSQDLKSVNPLSLTRTHPLVSELSSHVLETALDPQDNTHRVGSRIGAYRSSLITFRTLILLVRFRYEFRFSKARRTFLDLGEETVPLAFQYTTSGSQWLDEETALRLFQTEPTQNMGIDLAKVELKRELNRLSNLLPYIESVGKQRALKLEESFKRLREAARIKGSTTQVSPQGSPDILGLYLYLPQPKIS
jgi:ERCC4-related helicase